MQLFKLKHFLSRRISATELDKLPLARRLQSEHLFTSVDECIAYLNSIVFEKSLNPDDPFFISYKNEPIFAITMIDESLCSIIYESYQQRVSGDNQLLGYTRYLIDEFMNNLANKVDSIDPSKAEYKWHRALLTIIADIAIICTPEEQVEEVSDKKLAISYYTLMLELYKYARPYDKYFVMRNYYKTLLSSEIE